MAEPAPLVFAPDDPEREDVRALVGRHLAFAREVTPPDHVHALAVDGLLDPAVTLFGARRDGILVAIGALKELDATTGELKSMHTTPEMRGHGIGRAMVAYLLALAAGRGYRTVRVETGTVAAFAPALALYAKAGFRPCPPFGEYTANSFSTCMSLSLGPPG